MDALWLNKVRSQGGIHSTRDKQLAMTLTLDRFEPQRSSVMRNLRDALLNSKIYFCVLMLVSMSTLTPLSATTAPPLTIKVVNNSGWEIRRLYLSPVDNANWGPDQLNVSWDQSTVKLVAEDQDGCFMYTTVEATGNPVWTITSDTTRNCGG